MDGFSLFAVLCFLSLTTGQDWNYFGAKDQWHWGEFAPLCDSGKRQSPIDLVGLDTEYDEKLTEPSFTWNKNESDHILVYNDGRKVGSQFIGEILVEGANLPGTYKVHGYHWHWGRQDYKGSEHLYTERGFPIEVHLVTYSTRYKDVTEAVTKGDSNALAVFGTMYQITENMEDDLLNKYMAVFDDIKMPDANNRVRIPAFNKANMLSPDRTKYFRYLGSLTTPGCQEKVIWTNFVIPRRISKEQVKRFRTLSARADTFFPVGDNYRESQPLNDRQVLRSFKDIRPPITSCDEDTVAYEIVGAAASISMPYVLVFASILALYTV